ncbi:MAG: hypothetical protein JF615_08025, partial [Asticcacaulis sp.]|nr:hypothetical protein [Asticcacaulis sp.]
YTLFNILPFVSLITGWVMTAFAVTLGAQFWFDILSKLMTVRSTFKPGGGKDGGSVVDLSALAATLSAPPPGSATQTTPLLPSYTPDFKASAAAAPVSGSNAGGDDDIIDPSLRPRDA